MRNEKMFIIFNLDQTHRRPMKTPFLYIILGIIVITGCQNNGSREETLFEKLQTVEIKNPVSVMILKKTTFHTELLSNGKLKARNQSVLRFGTGEELAELKVKNGDHVRAGEEIARLRQDHLKQSLDQAELLLAKADLDLRDILLGYGYQLEDSSSIPANRMDVSKIRSGYNTAVSAVENARLDLANSVLLAPFSGVVANISHQVYEKVTPSEDFCTLIDNSAFEVEFAVLETEIDDIRLNKSVKVSLFIHEDEVYPGRITEINPVVDKYGHITVKARVENTDGLMEGMNVRVRIETDVPGQFVVPKAAVVQRQDQEVLFKYTSGTAYWTYVNTGLENSTSFTVSANADKGAELSAGDTVIISGNLNLAHGSEVEIEER